MAETLTIKLPDMKVEALAWGPPDGHLVLALHGWLDNAASFVPLAGFLDGVRLVAVDLPGHGRSDWRPAGQRYHFVDWVPDVVGLADALGAKRFSLLGHSLGAGIASIVAGSVPHRIERMVLVEGLGPLTDDPAVAASNLEKAIQKPVDPRRKITAYPNLKVAVERVGGARDKLGSQGARLLAIRGTRKTRRGFELRHDPRLQERSLLRMTEPQVLSFLERIECPVILVRADEGYAFNYDKMKARVERVSRCRVVELKGGHHIHLDHPDEVAAEIADFWGTN